MFQQITDKSILRVLITGFGLVIILVIVSGYVGIRSAQSIQGSAESLVGEQVTTARLIDEVHREQGALNAVFNNLSKEPDSVDRDQILSQLNDADQAIESIVRAAAGTRDVPLWRELQGATNSFSSEARRLLALEDAESLFSYNLLNRHEQVIAIVQKLIASGAQRSTQAQSILELRSKQLVRESGLLLGANLLLALLVAVFTVRTTARLSRTMEWQAGELSRVSWHMLENQETAARRFSHELHDELGQSLTAVKANLIALQSTAFGAGQERVADCLHLVDDSIRNVRELSQLLRPTILDDFGLDAGLRWLTERFSQRTGIDVAYNSAVTGRLPEETETHLFRIAQEALTNIARHSGATAVEMSLALDDGNVRLTIGDNGKGLPDTKTPGSTGLGMTGMHARARIAGGEFRVLQTGGKGLKLEACVPSQAVRHEQENKDLVSR